MSGNGVASVGVPAAPQGGAGNELPPASGGTLDPATNLGGTPGDSSGSAAGGSESVDKSVSALGGQTSDGEAECVPGTSTGSPCDSSTDSTCSRLDSATNPRTCVCGADDEWECTPVAGNQDDGGSLPASSLECEQGTFTGTSCDPTTDTTCSRTEGTTNPRACVCDDSEEWTCDPLE